MKRALILCLFMTIGINAGHCDTPYFPPLQPTNGSDLLTENNLENLQDPSAKTPSAPIINVNYPKISEVERSLYGRVYANQDITLRLARLEKSIFSATYPNSTLSQRVDNIILNFNQINQYSNISKTGLSRIEAKVFGRNYAQSDPQSRIERLEQELLGAIQEGDLAKRYETVKTAANSYNNNMAQDYYQNPLGTAPRGLKGLLGTLGSAFMGGGMMTGYTPSLDPFSTMGYGNNTGYGNSYGNNNYANLGGSSPGYGMYNGNRSNFGYSDQYKNYGTGSRVTILD